MEMKKCCFSSDSASKHWRKKQAKIPVFRTKVQTLKRCSFCEHLKTIKIKKSTIIDELRPKIRRFNPSSAVKHLCGENETTFFKNQFFKKLQILFNVAAKIFHCFLHRLHQRNIFVMSRRIFFCTFCVNLIIYRLWTAAKFHRLHHQKADESKPKWLQRILTDPV